MTIYLISAIFPEHFLLEFCGLGYGSGLHECSVLFCVSVSGRNSEALFLDLRRLIKCHDLSRGVLVYMR